jgi:hypothetical protein|tara:strand:+ start:17 stop:364 length:348 start_codon:yes stop_codon:yes gene_type:complete
VSTKILLDLSDKIEVISQAPAGNPYRLLFLAVIFQAMLDATKPEADNESAESVLERERAQGWLFSDSGVTATDFITICDLAGVDHGQVATFAHQVIRTGESTFIRRKINAILNHA